MNAWSHLPNSHHIDRIIKSVKSYPEIWAEANSANVGDSRDAALHMTMNAAWDAALDFSLNAALDAVWSTAWDVVRNAAWDVFNDAALALIAYDDANKYLDMTSDHLRIWAILSEDSAAILLLPAVIAFERINELECV
jgi:hypothetical protein